MRKTLLAVSLVAASMGMFHCGGDDTSPAADAASADTGTDAKVGAGGSNAGGGGSTADSGKTDGSVGGTSNNTGGAGGTGGTVGEGGPDANPADANPDAPSCPAQPVRNTACTQYRGRTCGACTCPATGVNATWQCPGGDSGLIDSGPACPATPPTDNTDCASFGGGRTCSNLDGWGTTLCYCRNRDSKWWCADQSTPTDAGCPATSPANQQVCRAAQTCDYGATRCSCPTGTRERWECALREAGVDAEAGHVDAADAASVDAEIDGQVDAADQ